MLRLLLMPIQALLIKSALSPLDFLFRIVRDDDDIEIKISGEEHTFIFHDGRLVLRSIVFLATLSSGWKIEYRESCRPTDLENWPQQIQSVTMNFLERLYSQNRFSYGGVLKTCVIHAGINSQISVLP